MYSQKYHHHHHHHFIQPPHTKLLLFLPVFVLSTKRSRFEITEQKPPPKPTPSHSLPLARPSAHKQWTLLPTRLITSLGDLQPPLNGAHNSDAQEEVISVSEKISFFLRLCRCHQRRRCGAPVHFRTRRDEPAASFPPDRATASSQPHGLVCEIAHEKFIN